MKRRSIRRRLLAGVAAVQIAAAVLATVLVVRHERERSYALLEAGLEEHAAVVELAIQPPDQNTGGLLLHRELLTLPKHDVYALIDGAGKVLASSGEWRMAEALPSAPRSFVTEQIGEKKYRLLVVRDLSLLNAEPDELAKLPKLMLVYGARMSGVEEHVWRVAWIAAGVGLAILLASLGATGWVVSAGLRPVVLLARRASQIDAANWDLERASDGQEAEELLPLSMALTHLVERLRTAFERERQFSADAAHEMKTAVAIVKSTLQLALERERPAEEYKLGISRALVDTERMQALVSGMLQLAKIESLGGGVPQEETPADALEELRRAERRLAPLLEERAIVLRTETHREIQPVRIMAEELGLVLMNLLENAIHYSADGSEITVKVLERGGECVLSIADAGRGIEETALPHIFERFYRGDASRSRESGGNGLGLAIVQAIVQKAGGSVMAESTPDAGSIFTVRLPAG